MGVGNKFFDVVEDDYTFKGSDDLKKIAEEELRETDTLRTSCLQQLRECIQKHPDIKKCRTDSPFLLRFLRTKKFSVPLALTMIERYLAVRQLYPQWFQKLDVDDPTFNEILESGYLVPLPLRDEHGRKIILSCAGRFDPYKYTAADMTRVHTIIVESMMDDEENQIRGYTYVNDERGLLMSHISLWSFSDIRSILKCIQNSTPMRHKSTHFINLPHFANKVFEFFNGLLSEKLRNRIMVHNSLDDFRQYFGTKILPKEYGGEVPLQDMIAQYKVELQKQKEQIAALEEMEIDLSKRGKIPDLMDDDLTGIAGSFRKLEILAEVMEALYENPNFLSVCEFIPNHLYFVTVQNINNGGSCEAVIPHTEDIHFFNTDTEFIYHNFYGDFGPLNITSLYKFCKKLTNKLAAYAGDPFYEKFVNSRFGRKEIVDKLQEKFVKKKIVVYYTSTNNEIRANAAFLISSFALLYLGYSPRMAYKTLQPNKRRYRPFQDASVGLSPYKINMKDCLDALHKASSFGFFNFNDFNVNECCYYENTEHGDLNWIVPQKFLAFPGPVEEKNDYYHHPNFYIEYFLCNSVTDVIRLNQRTYDAKCFTLFNMKHHDLYMQDGADPPDTVLKSFMNIAETATGAIAVHCKAGLGRTGSLIAAYLLKHYRMTPKEAIAWIRICRPGSVIGHQQTWLENHREMLWHQGNEWRCKMYGKTEIVPFLPYGIYSFETPKKEFPGLRELLINLTKRSRYRFVVKNRTKSSKAKLQQTIKTILNSGKPVKEKTKPKPGKRAVTPSPTPEEPRPVTKQSSFHTPLTPKELDSSKNLHYLKPPPANIHNEVQYTDSNWLPDPREIPHRFEHGCHPNLYVHEGKRPAMYSIPNSFYTNHSHYPEEEYSHGPKKYLHTVPKSRSERITSQCEKHGLNLTSKSIDKNWKQNNTMSSKYYRNYSEGPKTGMDNVCAFDTRADTLTKYSRFSRPYMSTGYSDQFGKPTSKYGCSKPVASSHGFLLSPEDLHSWMETFEENNGQREVNKFDLNLE